MTHRITLWSVVLAIACPLNLAPSTLVGRNVNSSTLLILLFVCFTKGLAAMPKTPDYPPLFSFFTEPIDLAIDDYNFGAEALLLPRFSLVAHARTFLPKDVSVSMFTVKRQYLKGSLSIRYSFVKPFYELIPPRGEGCLFSSKKRGIPFFLEAGLSYETVMTMIVDGEGTAQTTELYYLNAFGAGGLRVYIRNFFAEARLACRIATLEGQYSSDLFRPSFRLGFTF